MTELAVSFEEDLREAFLGHAFLHLTWDRPKGKPKAVCVCVRVCYIPIYPADFKGLEYYMVTMDSLSGGRSLCQKQKGLPISYKINMVRVSRVLLDTSVWFDLLLACRLLPTTPLLLAMAVPPLLHCLIVNTTSR